MSQILETPRLILRQFRFSDAEFILQLVNTPSWLQFIGDRGVKNLEDAHNYLVNGPLKSYQENGFGLSCVELKDSGFPVGMCGLIKRDTLEDIDIGFAMLPEYAGKGYGFEVSSALLEYAREELRLQRIVAITDPENIFSISLLKKLGLQFERTIKHGSTKEELLLFATI